MTTAEYAVGTIAAAGFAGILIKVLTDNSLIGWLSKLLKTMIEKFFGLG